MLWRSLGALAKARGPKGKASPSDTQARGTGAKQGEGGRRVVEKKDAKNRSIDGGQRRFR